MWTRHMLGIEERRVGLGEEFLGCVDVAIQQILRNPELFEKVEKDYRRMLVRRFPYAIFYESEGDRVIVYSVFHTAQDPEKWRSRLSL